MFLKQPLSDKLTPYVALFCQRDEGKVLMNNIKALLCNAFLC